MGMEIREYSDSWEQEVSDALSGRFGAAVEIAGSEVRRLFTKASRDNIHDVCRFLHDELNFEHCAIVMGVDMVDYMQVVYVIENYTNFRGLLVEITVDIQNDDLHIPTVSDIWGGANWHERETWELFGIVFDGHTNLKRLLTPDTYEFFPFRKSYKLRGQE